ncbi:MAG: GAF domain-containing protein [Anaerolineales bacterium]|nr:GAF domain-containing protein [Anaerolineales bacterium]
MKKKNDILEQVQSLAWNGKHAKAITLATQELDKPDLSNETRINLLDLRAESYIAQGKFDLSSDDADAMEKIADTDSLSVQAFNRKALVQMRLGNLKLALKLSNEALKIAQRTNQKTLIGISLLRIGEAQVRLKLSQKSVETAQKAIYIFNELGDISNEGRAYWVSSYALTYLGKSDEAREAAYIAQKLCQQAGDLLGTGNAWNVLYITDIDIADQIQHLRQAKKYFEAAGYIDRQSMVLGNVGLAYFALGLYSHSQRLQLETIRLTRQIGAKIDLIYDLANIVAPEIAINKLDMARAHYEELKELSRTINDPSMEVAKWLYGAELARAEGNTKKAIQLQKQAVKVATQSETGRNIIELFTLAGLYLESGNYKAALKESTKATKLHRSLNFGKLDTLPVSGLWWVHTQALLKNGKINEAEESLEIAHKFLMETIQSIRDKGFRFNALNKIKENRELLKYWVVQGKKRKLPKEKIYAHLYLESNTREPFTRLTDTSQRLNLLKTVSEIQTFLVEEATELSGGERVMLILEVGKKLEAAESLLPVEEEAEVVLASIKKHLTSARLTRTVQLILPKKQGLSRIIAPLIAQNQIIGYLYVDMDTIYGSFDETDRDMLGMLANQAAVALDNAGLVTGLEQKVNERTNQLRLSVEQNQRLLKETRTISEIGREISSSLETKIVLENIASYAKDLLNGELSALFIPTIETGKFKAIAAVGENAEELLNTHILSGEGILGTVVKTREGEIINDAMHDPRAKTLQGTEHTSDNNRHLLAVPLLSQNEIAGLMAIWRSGEGTEFTENELNFLTNLSRQAVIALKNAQLFSEAEEARQIAEKANRTKSAFLANMSHELRTPLNAIINFTELVIMEIMGPVTDEQKEALGYSLSSSQHLLQLINDVLDISKIQAGKLSLFMEEKVDLRSMIDETLTIIEPSVQKQADLYGYNIKLIRDVDADLPLVTCDQRRVKQVLLNLLSNAVKFTEKGSVTLSAKRKDGHILFSVMDTGKGIAPELQAQIFEPFVQTLDGVKHAEGTGLGLPITKSLVEAHGGSIWLESEVGEGSSFFFTLPAGEEK